MVSPVPKPKRDPEFLQKALKLAADEAVKKLSLHLDGRFTEEISSVKWDYPTEPKLRDIVDTGRLRSSQTRSVQPDGTVRFSWPVEYAQQVHDGGVAVTGTRFPGRPWTREPLAEAPDKFQEYFKEELEKVVKGELRQDNDNKGGLK